MKKVQHILYAIIVPAICLVMSSCGKNGKMSLGDERDYSDALFARGKLASIDIKVSENTWQKILSKASDKNYYECSVTINGEHFDDVGIRTKGASSLDDVMLMKSDRYSFTLKLNKHKKNQTYHGLSKLLLNNETK